MMIGILFHPHLQAQDRHFPPDAVVNVTLPPYGAIRDDGYDDTEVLQRAITDNVAGGCG